MSLLSVALALFLIMDPVGNIPSYLKMVNQIPLKRHLWIVLREMLIALAVMIVFLFIGNHLTEILNLSETTVRLSSGIVLFLIALKILFPASNSIRSNLPDGEPFIFPLAIPLIAGPSVLASIMLFSSLESCDGIMLASILIAWAAAMVILFFAHSIKRVLGYNGLMACERLMGMVLVLIAIQRFLEGIIVFWASKPT